LTKGARLVQPDVRADGSIVAVQLGADRTRLVRDDALGLTAVTLKTLMEETSAAE
jgi:hypothetical protein